MVVWNRWHICLPQQHQQQNGRQARYLSTFWTFSATYWNMSWTSPDTVSALLSGGETLPLYTLQEGVNPKPPLLFVGMHDDDKVLITGGWVHFSPSLGCQIFIFLYFLVQIHVAAGVKSYEPKILHFCVIYLPHIWCVKALTDSIMVRNKNS